MRWRRSLGGRPEHDTRVEVDLATNEPAGTSAAAQASTIASSRSSGASGIVTRTMSGRARSSTRSTLERAAEHGHALEAGACADRVVVDEADDLLARGLAQLAQQAPPAAAGADDQRLPAPPTGTTRAARRAALPEARRTDEHRADQRVDHEHALREVAEVADRREHAERDELREDDRGDDRAASRAPA